MANWLSNGPCPHCGSRDNYASYDDGSGWCWGCRHYDPPKHAPLGGVKVAPDCKPLPDDFGTEFGQDALDWLQKYDVPVQELLACRAGYSAKYNQIIYPWYDGTGQVIAWQGRNLSGEKSKYFTTGNVNDLLPIYYSNGVEKGDIVVIVEDCLSAIKIASTSRLNGLRIDAMPCLGSQVPPSKLKRLAGLYSSVLVWLDGNMLDSSLKMCGKLGMLGVRAVPIYTVLDPKELPYEEILEVIV